MSNIYIQEPPALGKVLLKTTVGDIDLELWTKEAPKACRNFIQLCMEGYYNGTIFHRVVPDFIVQGGDPNGDGTGGESVYGATFKDEFHSRLRFNRRGLVAMANAGKDDNGSQFFFTLNATPELQNKHTIFAKVTGETVFNMMKLSEVLTDQDDRPLYPTTIVETQVLVDPFGDIVPRCKPVSEKTEDKKKKKDRTGVKNFGLLSFGEEAEEGEDESTEFRGKPKSTHDLLDDPKLSRLTAQDINPEESASSSKDQPPSESTKAAVSSIRDKLQAKKPSKKDTKPSSSKENGVAENDGAKSEEEIEEYYLGKDRIEARKKQAESIRQEIRDLKREMSGKKKEVVAEVDEPKKEEPENNMVKDYEEEQEKYRKKKEQLPGKGQSREPHNTSEEKEKKPWVKNLYENTGHYKDNYTDVKFLEQMRKNVHPQNITFFESFLGSCRVTQKLSTCVIFCVLFTYLYNEWLSTKIVFGSSCAMTATGYIIYLIARYVNTRKVASNIESKIEVAMEYNLQNEKGSGEKYSYINSEEAYVNSILENSIESYLRRQAKKDAKAIKSNLKNSEFTKKKLLTFSEKQDSITFHIFSHLKTVLIFLVFGLIVSPILHTLTDTVSTDTIFATTAIMMIVHLIFSDYGISVAVVSNSLSINAAIFGSICLASRLGTSFHAFVLITLAVQCFVLFPILINMVLNSPCAIFVFTSTTVCAFISLWFVSKTMFCIFLVSVVFLNVYCPVLFVRWQKYKENIYGPWDEAIVHDSDDIEDCVGISNKSK